MTTTHWKAAAAEKLYDKLLPRIQRMRDQKKTLVEIADALNQAGYRTVDGTEFNSSILCLTLRKAENREPAQRQSTYRVEQRVQKLANEGYSVPEILEHLNQNDLRTEYGREWGIHNLRRCIREWGITFPPSADRLRNVAAAKAEEAKAHYKPIVAKVKRLQAQGHNMEEIADMLNEQGHTTTTGSPLTVSLIHRVMPSRRIHKPLDPKIVNKMIDMRNADKTLDEIAEYLNDRGITTAAGKPWKPHSVHYIVHGKDR